MSRAKSTETLGRIGFWGGRHASTAELARDDAARESLRQLHRLAEAMASGQRSDVQTSNRNTVTKKANAE